MNKTLTEKQLYIFRAMLNGAVLQSSEGTNYRVWLIYPDGTTEKLRKDSANSMLDKKGYIYFVYGEKNGIRVHDRYKNS